MKAHPILGLAALAVMVMLGLGAVATNHVTTAWQQMASTLPPVPDLERMDVSTVVVDRRGALLRPFTTADGRWRLPVRLDQVDRRLVEMLVAYEDKRFFTHEGVDWTSMVRAAGQFVLAGGRIVSGGSTLTMQVARLLEGGSTRALEGKLRQIVHADLLDRTLDKTTLLELYLTLAPYGGNIEGVRAASLAWFGKEPTRLTTAEAALLVALPQSPEARRPDRDPVAALNSRNMVLDRLAGAGVISAEDAEAAKAEPVPSVRRDFPLLAAHLAQEAVKTHPGLRSVGLTVDRRVQDTLERLASGRAGKLGDGLSVAILVADKDTGEILASVGSAGLFEDARGGHVDMTRAVRSPGSTLKPLIYGLAFEQGLAHPQSLIEDRPTAFGGYVPVNFDGFNRGTISVHDALVESLNIPAIIALDAVGTPRLLNRLRRAHADPQLPKGALPGLAIGLGGVGLTLRDLVSLYAAIARGGEAVELWDGVTEKPVASGDAAPVLDRIPAWYVSRILADVTPPNNGSAGRIAYKTGTSYGYRDAWAIGFDGRTVIGVWVGRPDGAAVPGITGASAAAPILFESFDRLGAATVPLPEAPAGALVASNADLPAPLRHFRHPDQMLVKRDTGPRIAYPTDGTDLDLGIGAGEPAPLVVKVRNGRAPFTFFANGAPISQSAFARQESWAPDGPGFVTLSVVDAAGRSDQVTVFLE